MNRQAEATLITGRLIPRSMYRSSTVIRRAILYAIDNRGVDWRKAVPTQNGKIRAMLDRCTVDGQIGVIVSGMDCDCTKYYCEYVASSWKSVAKFKKDDADRHGALDGPETVYYVKPEEIEPCSKSKDLALEAYENGHPSYIVDDGTW